MIDFKPRDNNLQREIRIGRIIYVNQYRSCIRITIHTIVIAHSRIPSRIIDILSNLNLFTAESNFITYQLQEKKRNNISFQCEMIGGENKRAMYGKIERRKQLNFK